jgi:ribokinase
MPLSTPHIVVVGSINMDLVAEVKQLPRAGETVDATKFSRGPGGKGANQAVAVSRLGASATMIGRIGDDLYGKELVDSLCDNGVDGAWIERESDCASGIAMITVDEQGENCITVVSGANALLSPTDICNHEGIIAAADAILLQLEVPQKTVASAVDVARKHNVMTVLDPAPAPSNGLLTLLDKVDVLTPNRLEAERLTERKIESVNDAILAAQELHRRGANRVIITMGSEGAVLCENNSCTHVTAPRGISVVDSTAAGDAFAAALTVQLALGSSFVKAVNYACVAGAVTTTKIGAQSALPSHAEVQSILEAALETY